MSDKTADRNRSRAADLRSRPASPAALRATSADGAPGRGPRQAIGIFHESAGAVVMVDGRCVALRRASEWVFPKGHLEAGERPEDAAVREVFEETGLDVRIVCELGSTRYGFAGPDSSAHRKRVHWFLAEAIGGRLHPEPPFEEAVLLDEAEVAALVTHQADRALAARAFASRGTAADQTGAASRADRLSPDASASIDPRARFPDIVDVVVEIPRGSRNKYEWDPRTLGLRLDRVLSASTYYNFNYGFVDDTRAPDGDPTDALLLVDESIVPGCHVWARPIGGLEMSDEHGADFKVLCVALGDPLRGAIMTLDQVEMHRLVEIEQFFATYKLLENKRVDVIGWRDAAYALSVLRTDRERRGEVAAKRLGVAR